MNKKIIGIFVCALIIMTTPVIVAHSIITKQQNETVPYEPLIEPLPVKKVKEIPIPWQFWEEFPQEGVRDVIVLSAESPSPVAIVRAYAVLNAEMPLYDLLWDNTLLMQMIQIDDPQNPYILEPGGQIDYFIQTSPYTKAVIVRYSVAMADTPDIIFAHFVNEAVIENLTMIGHLSNFDLHNDYTQPINNFELDLYGTIVSTDVLSWYGYPAPTPYLDFGQTFGPNWLGGWGAPPQIEDTPFGIEISWIDKSHPVDPCNWIHFGVHLKPGVTITGAQSYFTITKSKDKTVDKNILQNSLFLKFLQQYQNLFPILKNLFKD